MLVYQRVTKIEESSRAVPTSRHAPVLWLALGHRHPLPAKGLGQMARHRSCQRYCDDDIIGSSPGKP